jgi:ribosome maturation factor RimP
LPVIIYSKPSQASISAGAVGGDSRFGACTGGKPCSSVGLLPLFCYTSRLCGKDGRKRPFFVCGAEKRYERRRISNKMATDVGQLLESTLAGLGYEFVDMERSGKGKLLRVYIDRPEGIKVEDCAVVSNHLSRVFAVENIDYDRLEISSPGLDRLLRKEQDFVRFAGQKARIKVRLPVEGQRNFVGVLRETRAGKVEIEVDGKLVSIDISNLDKARLVPAI